MLHDPSFWLIMSLFVLGVPANFLFVRLQVWVWKRQSRKAGFGDDYLGYALKEWKHTMQTKKQEEGDRG